MFTKPLPLSGKVFSGSCRTTCENQFSNHKNCLQRKNKAFQMKSGNERFKNHTKVCTGQM